MWPDDLDSRYDTNHRPLPLLNKQSGERFIQLRFEMAEDELVDVVGQALLNAGNCTNPREELAKENKQALAPAVPRYSVGGVGPEM